VSDYAWIYLWAFSSILYAISRSALLGCCCHLGHLKTSVRWRSSSYILSFLWGTLVSWVDLLKLYLRERTSFSGCRSLSYFWDITVGTWGGIYCEGLASEEERLREYISTSSSSTSLTSSIFTKDHLDGVSREERDGDSEWVGRLGGIGGVKGLGCVGVGRKSIGAGSSTPKGSDADNSISGVSLLGGICSLEWEDRYLGKCPLSKIAWVEWNITFPYVWWINL